MKQFARIFTAAAFLLCFSTLSAQMTEEENQAFMNYMMPGKMQEKLAKANGEWKESITVWMKPGAPPMQMEASCKNEMIMDGRYQLSTTTGNMMGMPFEGHGLTGYDNVRKVFVTTWVDNMSTGIMYLEGKWNDAGNSIDFVGQSTDPMAGKAVGTRQVLTFMDDKNHKLEMFVMHEGKEFKTMEIIFSR